MLALIEVKKVESGDIIFNKGDESEFAHLILYGEVFLFDSDKFDTPLSNEDLALASRSNSTAMKKVSIGGLVG